MARALIVGCGCRGLELAAALLDGGWRVRGTTRSGARAGAIAAAGVEPAIADPDRLATLLDHVADVALVCWLLGSADGGAGRREAVHGPRLERFLEEIVDTPVRGFLYEAAGSVEPRLLASGATVVRAAGERWRIPVEVVETPPGDPVAWRRAMVAAATRLAG